jgi:putrescine transport system substrate-binding protein
MMFKTKFFKSLFCQTSVVLMGLSAPYIVWAQTTSAEKLHIYNWAEYIPDYQIHDFEKSTGIEVWYDTFDTDETVNQKIAQAHSDYDIVVPSATFMAQFVREGKFTALDKTRIPNLRHLNPQIMAQLAKIDPGNQYLVPWAWGYTTVGINEAQVKKALGALPMPSNPFDLIFNPKYSSKLKSCGIFYLDSPTDVMASALNYMGKDIYSSTPADVNNAVSMLRAVRGDIRRFGDSSAIYDIADGKYCAFLTWATDVNLASERAANPSIRIPSAQSGVLFIDVMAIPKSAPNVNNAHTWINDALEPQVSAQMTNDLGYATANQTAWTQGLIQKNRALQVPDEALNTMVIKQLPNEPATLNAMNQGFQKFRYGK